MTLIAAFRCDTFGVPGIVICADSQETRGDYRVPVDKIFIQDAESNLYQLVVGGSGDIGDLIDDFAESLGQTVTSWNRLYSEQSIKRKIKRLLVSFNKNEVEHYPADPSEKQLEFIICLKVKDGSDMYLWKSFGTALTTVHDFALAGVGGHFCKPQVKKLYGTGVAMTEAVLLGVYILSQAKETINDIGGPSQFVTVRPKEVTTISPEHIQELEQRNEKFNDALRKLVLACPDLSLQNEEFEGVLKAFEQEIKRLRQEYFQLAANEYLDQIRDHPQLAGAPYPMLPGGMLVRGEDRVAELIPLDQVDEFLRLAATKTKEGKSV